MPTIPAETMRRPALSFALALAFATPVLHPLAAIADQAPVNPGVQTLRLEAARVRFYNDRWLLEADGDVHISFGALRIRGEAFSMDLKQDRFVVAGSVRLATPAGTYRGAAFSDFLDFRRCYLFAILAPGDEPDHWTFVDGDFAHPQKGLQMPGDAFALPNLAGASPDVTAHSAVVGTTAFVRFAHPLVRIAGMDVPLPSYYVSFSADPDLAQNSLAGANFDGTLNLTGDAHAISAVHLRYDTQNKGYLAVEQHLASKNAFAVFSINPLTRPSKFWNLVTGWQPSPRFGIRTFSQVHTFQYGLRQPLESSQFTAVQLTQALRQSFLQVNLQQVNYTMLAPSPTGYYGDPTHAFVPNHPSSVELGVTTFQHQIGRLPSYESLHYGAGFTHDVFGLQTYGGVTYTTIWNHYAGLTLFTSSLPLGDRHDPLKTYFFNATFAKQRQWFSVPHYIDTTDTVASLSRRFSNALTAYVAYEVNNTGDYYLQGGYGSYVPIVDGTPIYGFAAFHGVATLRTLSLGAAYQPNGEFSASLLLRKHDDFPQPYPGLFPPPPLNVLGESFTTNYLGQPPYDITGEVRARIAPRLSVDIQRTYFFNFGTLRWSPQFVIQVIPQ